HLLAHSHLYPYTTLFRSRSTIASTVRAPCLTSRRVPAVSGVSVSQHTVAKVCRTASGASETAAIRSPRATSTSSARRTVTLRPGSASVNPPRSEEHTSELQSRFDLVCRLLLE